MNWSYYEGNRPEEVDCEDCRRECQPCYECQFHDAVESGFACPFCAGSATFGRCEAQCEAWRQEWNVDVPKGSRAIKHIDCVRVALSAMPDEWQRNLKTKLAEGVEVLFTGRWLSDDNSCG